jgi:predicted metal-dependent phosphoesterase TrpH
MNSGVDLHLHTNASDGRLSPVELVKKAASSGLKIIAITDHDIMDGITSALREAKKHAGIVVVPGVEISTDCPEGDVHLLGYFNDYSNLELKQKLDEMRTARIERAEAIIENLGKLGMPLHLNEVMHKVDEGSVGRPHIAQVMLEKGYISSISEAFHKYIGRGGPAYAERIKMTPKEAVKLVLHAGGIPVLAHPLTLERPEPLVASLKKVGLVGLEVFYSEYNKSQILSLKKLAKKYELLITGGTDFHGLEENVEIGWAEVPLSCGLKLLDRLGLEYPSGVQV